MHLTQYTDIGLRVLMYLTQCNRETLVTVSELSVQFSLSSNHVNKVVNQMVKLHWIKSTRGRNGGLSLLIAPEKLKLGNIIESLEVDEALVNCEKSDCSLDGQCRLQGILSKALQDFYRGLDDYTLADIVTNPTAAVLIQMHRHWKAA